MAKVVFHQRGWNEVVEHVIDTEGVKRMKRVADACNAALVADKHDTSHGEGFKVSTEGDDPLTKRNYRATVITATAPAMAHNAKHNTLVKSLHLAGGE